TPVVVTATASPSIGLSSFLSSVMLSNSGFGLFIANIQKAEVYTITVRSGEILSTANVNVVPAQAVRLAFDTQPPNAPTGVKLAPVAVQVDDQYGNVVSSDNSDKVTLGVASGPGAFSGGSTLTAAVVSGVATFNNLTLITPGTYQLS